MNYSTTNIAASPDLLAAVLVIFGIIVLLGIAFYVVYSIFLSKIFKKAGLPAWQAWVPLLNTWRLLELGGKKGYWALLSVAYSISSSMIDQGHGEDISIMAIIMLAISIGAGIAYIIISIIAIHNISLKLQYGAGMTICGIFLPIIWVIVLGVSKNQWNDSLGAPRADRLAVAPAYPQAAPTPMVQPAVPMQPHSPMQPQTPVYPMPESTEPQTETPVQPESPDQFASTSEPETTPQDESQPTQR